MDHTLTAYEAEIVKQVSLAVDGLSTHTRAARGDVVFSQFRNQLLQRPRERGLDPRTILFGGAHLPVLACHFPEAGPLQHPNGLGEINIAGEIAFAAESQQRVRAGFDAAVDVTGEVHAEEWKARIGDRI